VHQHSFSQQRLLHVILRRFYRPKSAITASTCMRLRQKKPSGTARPATEMMTWRTLRHHPKPEENPANMNVLVSVMETKQVQETSVQQTMPIEFSSSREGQPEQPNLTFVLWCRLLAIWYRIMFKGENGFGFSACR